MPPLISVLCIALIQMLQLDENKVKKSVKESKKNIIPFTPTGICLILAHVDKSFSEHVRSLSSIIPTVHREPVHCKFIPLNIIIKNPHCLS